MTQAQTERNMQNANENFNEQLTARTTHTCEHIALLYTGTQYRTE